MAHVLIQLHYSEPQNAIILQMWLFVCFQDNACFNSAVLLSMASLIMSQLIAKRSTSCGTIYQSPFPFLPLFLSSFSPFSSSLSPSFSPSLHLPPSPSHLSPSVPSRLILSFPPHLPSLCPPSFLTTYLPPSLSPSPLTFACPSLPHLNYWVRYTTTKWIQPTISLSSQPSCDA